VCTTVGERNALIYIYICGVFRSSHLRGSSRYVTEPHKGPVQPLLSGEKLG
jgi:hypothetical protein